LKDRLIKGKYLDNGSEGILLAEGLARSLQVDIGDTILIYGQGLYGVTAAELVPVQGILKFNIPAQNNGLAYLSLPYSQWIYSAYDRITSLSIMIDNTDNLDQVASKAHSIFDDRYDVLTWRELSPELVQSIQIDNAQGIIMLGILYIVIAFGIFGTIMMMTAERRKEFGVLISVGMRKWKLYIVSLLETFFISFIGVAAGAIASLPILIYFVNNPIPLSGEYADAILAWGFEPIIPFAINAGMFIAQIWTVLAIALVSGLYPVNFIRKIKPVEAIRG
jgi:putative ABC transport system permease protein